MCPNLWLGVKCHQMEFNWCHHFTDNKEIVRDLEELYGDIDAVEFYPGLMVEQARQGAMLGEGIVEMGAPFSLKGLLGNPICSPEYWKPSTFGGKVGFDMVNSATLKKLVCLNAKSCPYVAFRIPNQEKSHRSDNSKARTDELWPSADTRGSNSKKEIGTGALVFKCVNYVHPVGLSKCCQVLGNYTLLLGIIFFFSPACFTTEKRTEVSYNATCQAVFIHSSKWSTLLSAIIASW